MFAEQGLNAVLYYQNKDFVHNVSLVPTSAHTGEGIPDMLALLIQLTQTKLTKKIVTKDLFQVTHLSLKTPGCSRARANVRS
jgi:translation initiation factor 5B